MRYFWLALGGLLLWQTAGWAQQPPYQPPQTPPAQPPQTPPGPVPSGQVPPAPAVTPGLDPEHNPLDAFLMNWEKAMRGIETLVAPQCTRLEDNKTFRQQKFYVGQAKYVKPNLALLEMYRKDRPEDFEKYVCNGSYLYQYVPQTKEIREHQLPPPKAGQVADENFLSFIFGMRAEEAKRRYDLKLVKEDQYYAYVDIAPRFDQDRADFKRARLVLNKDSYLPRQLWFEQPDGSTVTWDIPTIKSGEPLDKNEFMRPAVPPGWKVVQPPVPRDQPTYRPSNPGSPGTPSPPH